MVFIRLIQFPLKKTVFLIVERESSLSRTRSLFITVLTNINWMKPAEPILLILTLLMGVLLL